MNLPLLLGRGDTFTETAKSALQGSPGLHHAKRMALILVNFPAGEKAKLSDRRVGNSAKRDGPQKSPWIEIPWYVNWIELMLSGGRSKACSTD